MLILTLKTVVTIKLFKRRKAINFPVADDETKVAIQDATGRPVYIIDRSNYIKYEDGYGLK